MTEQQADFVCQIHITASQAALLVACMNEALSDAAMPMPVIKAVEDLASFFAGVAERPQDYPMSGQMSRTLKVMKRRRKPGLSKKHRANLQKLEAARAKRAESQQEQAEEGLFELIEEGEFQ